MINCVILFLFLSFFFISVDAQCASYTSCTTCTANLACGWCTKTKLCVAGNKNGPTSGTCSVGWAYSTSVFANPVKGYPIDPQSIDVYLYPNVPLVLNFSVTVPLADNLPLDVMFVQDTSGSMDDDISVLFSITPNIANGIKAFQYRTRFGLASFIDIPSTSGGSYANIWRYKLETSIKDSFLFMQNKLLAMRATNNYDAPESSFDAMMFTAICYKSGYAARDPLWNPSARKIAITITDDYAKCSPECAAGYQDSSQNLDDPRRASSGSDPRTNANAKPGYAQTYVCSDTDYVTISGAYRTTSQAKLIQYLGSADIIPIFLVGIPLGRNGNGCYSGVSPPISDCPATQAKLKARYDNFISLMGTGTTRTMDASSPTAKTDMVNAIISAIKAVGSVLSLTKLSDSGNFLTSGPTPVGCSGCTWSATQYSNVVEGQTYIFSVTLTTSTAVTVNTNTVVLRAPGLGDQAISTIYIRNYLLTCLGCDNVLNSNQLVDVCGICAGNGTTCIDCYGNVVPNGAPITKFDQCLVCGGDGTSCLGCDNKPYPPPQQKVVRDLCGVCNGTNSCVDCKGVVFGQASYDQCGVCGGNNTCVGCDGLVSTPKKVVDVCGICGGNGLSCRDCFNIPNGQATYDLCGVCNGTNTCLGCDGIPNSGKVPDQCGVCGGTNACKGCDGVANSGKVYDLCGICGGTNTCFGCDGVPYSGKTIDSCGVCGGNNNTCFDCQGVKNGGKVYDKCGVCGGNNTCVGCDNIPNSGLVVDLCGVCGGANGCVGCDMVPNSGLWYDQCGVCNGTNACVGCNGIPFSGWEKDLCGTCCDMLNNPQSCNQCRDCNNTIAGTKVYDRCGVCGGNNECIGCDNVPYSGKVFDLCGICGGTNGCVDCFSLPWGPGRYDICGVCYNSTVSTSSNLTCLDCFRIPFGTAVLDACGVCNGDNSTCLGCDGITYPLVGGLFVGPVYDSCGVCGGDDSSCRGCDGSIPQPGRPPKRYDNCSVCGGTNACLGCDGVPGSGLIADVCGNCPANNTACYSCNGIPYGVSGAGVIDACGVCDGKITNSKDCSRKPIPTQAVIGISVGSGVAAMAGLFAAFIIYQRVRKGPNWLIQDAIPSMEIVGTNPLYEASGREQFNALYIGNK